VIRVHLISSTESKLDTLLCSRGLSISLATPQSLTAFAMSESLSNGIQSSLRSLFRDYRTTIQLKGGSIWFLRSL